MSDVKTAQQLEEERIKEIESIYQKLREGTDEEKAIALAYHMDKMDNFVWSYSRVNSFCICKKMFFYEYILGLKGGQNFFSQYGLMNHSIFEMYAREEIDFIDIPSYYEDKFKEAVTIEAPPSFVNLHDKYFDDGMRYWSGFEGFDDDTIGTECKLSWTIKSHTDKKYRFVGYADRVALDKDGHIRLIDYKSKGKWKSRNERKLYFRQLYLYCIGVKKMFRKYPTYLQFNQYRIGTLDEIRFDKKDFDEAVEWALQTIESIYGEVFFDCQEKKTYFCDYLCGHKAKCQADGNWKENNNE